MGSMEFDEASGAYWSFANSHSSSIGELRALSAAVIRFGAAPAVKSLGHSSRHLPGKEYPDEAYDGFVDELSSSGVEVAVEHTNHPGPPYFTAILAFVPAAVAAAGAKTLVSLIQTWLEHRNDREVEITLPDGTAIRLKGANASLADAEDALTRLLADGPAAPESESDRSDDEAK